MAEFKIGDKVYIPKAGNQVFKLERIDHPSFPLTANELSFNLCGFQNDFEVVPSLFHATAENKENLEALYKMRFAEAPPKTFKVTIEVPITFIPEHGQTYWYINYGSLNGVNCAVNCGNALNDRIISRGAWRTEEEALIAAEAVFNLKLGT